MNQCSRRRGGHDIPSVVGTPGHRQGHDLSIGLVSAQRNWVLTHRRLPTHHVKRRAGQASLEELEIIPIGVFCSSLS